MEFGPCTHLSSYNLASNHCQLFLVLQPGNNWPIPVLSLLVTASPVWVDNHWNKYFKQCCTSVINIRFHCCSILINLLFYLFVYDFIKFIYLSILSICLFAITTIWIYLFIFYFNCFLWQIFLVKASAWLNTWSFLSVHPPVCLSVPVSFWGGFVDNTIVKHC